MKRIAAIAGSACLGLLGLAAAEGHDPAHKTPADNLLKMGAYVAASDVERSAVFYEAVLGQSPVMALDGFVMFDVAGGILAVVSKDKYAPGAEPSLAAVPYIQVQDLERLRARVSGSLDQPVAEIIKEPGIDLLKLQDPEGQTVEFFQLIAE
ncbi:MAG: hypothetical protein AAGA24_04940 [Pseudomonadota bacterium]